MTLTRKFSQFVPQAVTSVVGLTGGANSIGPNSGGGGGSGAVTQVITQANSFTPGQWVRFDEGTNLYVAALATTPQNAEVVGVVIAVAPPGGPPFTQFTLQQSGYVTIAQAVFPVLTPGQPQFLSDVAPGAMVNTDVIIDGEVSRPVFLPDKDDGVNSSGWVLPYRGIIVGGPNPGGGGGGTPGTNPNIVTVVLNNHNFNAGDWLRVTNPAAGPQTGYTLALADTLANSQSVGVVIDVIDVNTFVLQFSGYVSTAGTITAPFQDELFNPLTPATVYYLSSINAGFITAVDPGLTGGFSKPLFISEQTIGTVNTDAGYVLPQRPLSSPNNGNVFLGYLNAGNGFSSINILTGYIAYQLIFVGNFSVVGGAPSALGLQPYIGGAFGAGVFSHYTDGVSSIAGINTATFFGHVGNGGLSIVNYLNLFPSISNNFLWGNSTGTIILNGNAMVYNYDADVSDFSAVPTVGYSYQGSDGGGGAAPPTGLRMFVDGPGVLTTTPGAHIAIYGIPNA